MGSVLTHGMVMFITTRLKGVKKGKLPVSRKLTRSHALHMHLDSSH